MTRKCRFGSQDVDCSVVSVDFHSFGKRLAPEYAKPYQLSVCFADAIECFSDFYRDFLDRESEDEGFDEPVQGDYLLLQKTGYLSFEKMLSEEPDVLARVLLNLLPVEFMGYLFRGQQRESGVFLQTLTRVVVRAGLISCEGDAFEVFELNVQNRPDSAARSV